MVIWCGEGEVRSGVVVPLFLSPPITNELKRFRAAERPAGTAVALQTSQGYKRGEGGKGLGHLFRVVPTRETNVVRRETRVSCEAALYDTLVRSGRGTHLVADVP